MEKKYNFTKEQEQWLCDNYHKKNSYSELTLCFNDYFGTNRKVTAIQEKCTKRLGLIGIKSQTTYGIKKKEELPIGTIRKSQTGTYIKVQSVNEAGISGYAEPYWMPIQKKIYQDSNGEISKDKMVCFLDHNPENFSLDNLYPIDRRISAIMSKNKWWSESKEITLSAIKWCELHYAIKDLEG